MSQRGRWLERNTTWVVNCCGGGSKPLSAKVDQIRCAICNERWDVPRLDPHGDDTLTTPVREQVGCWMRTGDKEWRGTCACINHYRQYRIYDAAIPMSPCLQCRTMMVRPPATNDLSGLGDDGEPNARIVPMSVEQQSCAAAESRAHRLELRCIDLHRQLIESEEAYARLAAIDTRRQVSIEASLRQELKLTKALIDLYENGLLDGQFLLEGRMDEIRALLPISIRETFREDDPNYPKKVMP